MYAFFSSYVSSQANFSSILLCLKVSFIREELSCWVVPPISTVIHRTNSIAALRAKAQEHSAKLFAGLDPAEHAKLFTSQAGGVHLGAHHVTSSANSSTGALHHVISSANGGGGGALHHVQQAQNGLYSSVDHSTSVF